jgi:hypothetical protein
MTKRVISGLRWAKALADRPSCIPVGRARGVKAFGVRYERAVGKQFPREARGRWFEYEDRNGLGYCQVDLLLGQLGRLIVVEAKYTWTLAGHEELETLYLPVVEKAFGLGVCGVVVSRNLTRETLSFATVFHSIETAAMTSAKRAVWHWMGDTAVQPRNRTNDPWMELGL